MYIDMVSIDIDSDFSGGADARRFRGDAGRPKAGVCRAEAARGALT